MKYKIVAGITTKNDDWIIEKTLKAIDKFCDTIVVYDDGSTDSTEEISRSFDKVRWYVRPSHDPLVREEAKQRLELIDILRKYDSEYVLLLDSDEIPTPSIIPFLEKMPSDITAWKIRMINLWDDKSKYRTDSYTTKFGTSVNWNPFATNFWGKCPLMKFDKECPYTYNLNVQKGGCSPNHPAPSNLPGEIQFTDEFYIMHYGKIAGDFLDEERLKFYAAIEAKQGKGSFESRLDWHREHNRTDTLATQPTRSEWFWE